MEVIRCLLYLGRQGIALQGQDGKENFTQLLRLLSTNDTNILYHLEGKIGYKYTHNDVQNEILGIKISDTTRKVENNPITKIFFYNC